MIATRERRAYEVRALAAVRQVRQLAIYWARRCRKSTTLGSIAFDEMSKGPGRMVIAASASLLLGKELIGVTLSAAEQAMIVANEAAAVRAVFEQGAGAKNLDFKVADSAKTDKFFTGLTPEDFAELYHSSRMELRLYFDRTTYSREQIIAPNPATARSWRALVLRDEAGFTPVNFEMELRNATDPMMRDTPDLKMIYASNLSANDRHPWFETTLPREINHDTEDDDFPPNPNGHFYIGQHGILVQRVALKDAYAADHKLYDDHGEPMTYEECRTFPQFKSGWEETYALNHKSGGAAAIDLIALINAQRRGVGQCNFVFCDTEADFKRGLHLLEATLKTGPVGIGFDVASTTAETSNPSSITVTENVGGERFQRLIAVFKSKKRVVMSSRLEEIVRLIRARREGGPARRLCIDASNERLAAEETKDDLAALIPVELVLGGNVMDPRPPGYAEKDGNVNYKTFIGDIYCAAVNDARTAMPPDIYVKQDHRLPVKDAGRYKCTPEPDGKHGDTFDSGKLAEYALTSTGGAIMTTAGIHLGAPARATRTFQPRRLARA